MNSEYTANDYMQALSTERARWAAALARPANHPIHRATVRKSLIARLLGL